jgi:hypothetical protein
VAGNDDVSSVDQNRDVEAELTDRRRNLVKLLLGVQPGITRVGLQVRNREIFNV